MSERKVYEILNGRIEEVSTNQLPEQVQKVIKLKNWEGQPLWIEIGICPDLSTFRVYKIETNGRLTQLTGSMWKFWPFNAYVTEEGKEMVEKFLKEGG